METDRSPVAQDTDPKNVQVRKAEFERYGLTLLGEPLRKRKYTAPHRSNAKLLISTACYVVRPCDESEVVRRAPVIEAVRTVHSAVLEVESRDFFRAPVERNHGGIVRKKTDPIRP